MCVAQLQTAGRERDVLGLSAMALPGWGGRVRRQEAKRGKRRGNEDGWEKRRGKGKGRDNGAT